MNPIIKWTGGKRKEIILFKDFLPLNIDDLLYIEPFFGGGSLFFYLLPKHSVINDFDADLMCFYRAVKDQDECFLKMVTKFSKFLYTNKDNTKIVRGEEYYKWRQLKPTNNSERAARFYIVNQMAFNGMRRFNAKGEFNIPYGNYKSLDVDRLRDKEVLAALNNSDIHNGEYTTCLLDKKDCFIFIDPPYTRVFKEYSPGNIFAEDEQRKLASRLKSLKHSKWMVIIDKSDLTVELYKDHIIKEYSLRYGNNIKNRYNSEAIHIVCTNYKLPTKEKKTIFDD